MLPPAANATGIRTPTRAGWKRPRFACSITGHHVVDRARRAGQPAARARSVSDAVPRSFALNESRRRARAEAAVRRRARARSRGGRARRCRSPTKPRRPSAVGTGAGPSAAAQAERGALGVGRRARSHASAKATSARRARERRRAGGHVRLPSSPAPRERARITRRGRRSVVACNRRIQTTAPKKRSVVPKDGLVPSTHPASEDGPMRDDGGVGGRGGGVAGGVRVEHDDRARDAGAARTRSRRWTRSGAGGGARGWRRRRTQRARRLTGAPGHRPARCVGAGRRLRAPPVDGGNPSVMRARSAIRRVPLTVLTDGSTCPPLVRGGDVTGDLGRLGRLLFAVDLHDRPLPDGGGERLARRAGASRSTERPRARVAQSEVDVRDLRACALRALRAGRRLRAIETQIQAATPDAACTT